MLRPRVFLDISIGLEPAGRLTFELFIDKTPKTCENFRALCSGSQPPLTYKLSPFHRIIDQFMVQGGDVTKGNGTGGASVYGHEFADENIGWRDIDAAGLLCMANRGKDTNLSQFFITLTPCTHLNTKHTVFGRLVTGQSTLQQVAQVPVDSNDTPKVDVLISHCGEIEQNTASLTATNLTPINSKELTRSRNRGRRDERFSRSRSRSSSRSEYQHRRHHRHGHRRKYHSPYSSSYSAGPEVAGGRRRRSDASSDHNLRGRPRSRTVSPEVENELRSVSPAPRHKRKRSLPPSRHSPGISQRRDRRSRSPEGYDSRRRRRSLPNQYRTEDSSSSGMKARFKRYQGTRNEKSLGREERAMEEGQLDGRSQDEQGGAGNSIVYKGRGSMKYRERRMW